MYSWERIFLFPGRITWMDFLFFFLSRQGWQSMIEKGGGKKLWEEMEAALMCRWRPAKCSAERTAGFVAMLKSSKRFNKLLVWHGQHVGVGFRSESSAMVACQIPVSYETAIQNSMTLGIGEKWFLPRWRHSLRPEHPVGILPFTKQTRCLSHTPSLSAINFKETISPDEFLWGRPLQVSSPLQTSESPKWVAKLRA